MINRLLIVCLFFTFTGCGFQLRGSSDSFAINADSIFVSSQSANATSQTVKSQLEYQGIATPDSKTNVDYILLLSNEKREKNVLTVSSTTGKVQEYELIYSVYMSVTDQKGNRISDTQLVSASRDLFFDENAVLALGEEERIIYQELQQQIGSTILQRLQAVIQ